MIFEPIGEGEPSDFFGFTRIEAAFKAMVNVEVAFRLNPFWEFATYPIAFVKSFSAGST